MLDGSTPASAPVSPARSAHRRNSTAPACPISLFPSATTDSRRPHPVFSTTRKKVPCSLQRIRPRHSHPCRSTAPLFAALNAATGEVIGSLHRRHRAVEFKKFLAKLDKEVPGHLDVHLIRDNYATHKTPAIQKWLLAHPRFHMHFTPTSSSWFNQVERWFALLTDKQIRRGVHRNVQALEKDIRAWIADWNDNPRPLVWTKTADEIFERLSGYLNRIKDSRH
ncbi:IS630 family transposase [Streptomyces sp. NPDC051286]|uniref:IS630 family transposase n=1 Tax=Streptomyces sp. NPDC051286 TaxID=3365647 RepID=UPI00378D9D1B